MGARGFMYVCATYAFRAVVDSGAACGVDFHCRGMQNVCVSGGTACASIAGGRY